MVDPDYTAIELPEIVRKANALADALRFPLMPEGRPLGYDGPPSACIPQVERLLQTLAAGKPGGLIGEFGYRRRRRHNLGASGLAGGARLITMEIDPKLANAAKVIFESYPQVEFRIGDWHETIRNESFDLLFMDSGVQDDLRRANWDNMIAHIKLGGQIVMDDLTPAELWPAEWKTPVVFAGAVLTRVCRCACKSKYVPSALLRQMICFS